MEKTDQIIDELEKQLFIVEGEVTDLLTSYSMQNLNTNMQNGTGAVAIGSAILGQVGNAALSHMVTSDEGIEVSDFAVELTDQQKVKHYFIGCFPEVVFKKNDQVKVIAEPHNEKYAYVVAIIDPIKNYIWTGQEVVKGRFRYRVFGIKLIGSFGFVGLIISIIIVSLMGGFESLLRDFMLITMLMCLLLFVFIGWRVGASFDGQSIVLEAILKKLGFNKPTRMDLQNFALSDLSMKNKEDNKGYGYERWKDYTYRIDLAKQQDEEKYGKNK